MVQITVRDWQLAGVAAAALIGGAALYWRLRSKPLTEEELEQTRRDSLYSFGRIVDGYLIDRFELVNEQGQTRDMLLYQYEIAGVLYESSQDITLLHNSFDPAQVKVGFPCSIRYQPGSPENSILISEGWTGLRESIPVIYQPLQQLELAPVRNRAS